MENRAHALAAGLFLLLLSAAALVAVMWFRGDHVARRTVVVVTRESISGLNVKAPVRLRGVDVGKVESIDFDPADARQILIGLQINASAPLTRGTYAQLGFQGVTGLSFVALADTGSDQRALPEDDTPGAAPPRIALQPTLFDQLANAGPRLIGNASEASRRVNEWLSDGNREQIEHALARLNASLAEVNRLLVALQPAARMLPDLVRDADAGTRRAGQVLSTAQDALAQAQPALAHLDGTLQGFERLARDADGLTGELRGRTVLLDQLGSAAAQIETTTRHLDATLGGTPGTATPLLPELTHASQALSATARQLQEQPQSLIFGPVAVPPGPGEAGFDRQSHAGALP
ncbi:MAG: MCE family protein [Pseudomonadota bacterium]|nr:MCE family protein [Pseudomonadota bacterium]